MTSSLARAAIPAQSALFFARHHSRTARTNARQVRSRDDQL